MILIYFILGIHWIVSWVIPFAVFVMITISIKYIKKKSGNKLFTCCCLFGLLAAIVVLIILYNDGIIILCLQLLMSIVFVFIMNKYKITGFRLYFKYGMALQLFIISAYLIPLFLLGSSGYCFDKNCYLTEQEKIDAVVKDVITSGGSKRKRYYMNENGAKIFEQEEVETFYYSHMSDFYNLNPDCCELVDVFNDNFEGNHQYYINSLSRIKGTNTFVRVYYIYDYDKYNNPLYKLSYYAVENCGAVVPSMYMWEMF